MVSFRSPLAGRLNGDNHDRREPAGADRRGVRCRHVLLELILDLAAKGLVIGLSLYPLTRSGSSHFAGKAMGVRALVYPGSTLVIPAVWLAAGTPGPYPFLADIAFALPFALDAAGNVFGWFAVKGFDRIPHSVGWFFLTVAFGLAVAPLAGERWIGFGLALGFGAVADIVWEMGEFALMRSGASGLQLTYDNTIQDLGMSLLGAVGGASLVATLLWPAAGTARNLFGWS